MQVLFSNIVFWHWFGMAILLSLIDVIVGGNFFFICWGLCAGLIGVLLLIFPGLSWESQFLFFGIAMILSSILWRAYFYQPRVSEQQPSLNRRAEQYIGRKFTLEEPIRNGRGRIKVDDSIWRIQGDDLPEGTKIQVVSVDSMILKVKKID